MAMTYKFPTWWGGETFIESTEPPQIHKKLIAIRKAVGGLKAKKEATGPNFAVRKASDLMAKLRTAIDKEECHVMVVSQSIITGDLDKIPPDGKGRVFRSAATVTTRVRICAPDGSFVEGEGSGGGGDADDKAVGKASTYSYKDALIKLLTLPDADTVDTDDEAEHGAVPAIGAEAGIIIEAVAKSESREDLKQYAADAKKLRLHEQKAVGDAIRARLASLAGKGEAGGGK